jgi:hypothetical protein
MPPLEPPSDSHAVSSTECESALFCSSDCSGSDEPVSSDSDEPPCARPPAAPRHESSSDSDHSVVHVSDPASTALLANMAHVSIAVDAGYDGDSAPELLSSSSDSQSDSDADYPSSSDSDVPPYAGQQAAPRHGSNSDSDCSVPHVCQAESFGWVLNMAPVWFTVDSGYDGDCDPDEATHHEESVDCGDDGDYDPAEEPHHEQSGSDWEPDVAQLVFSLSLHLSSLHGLSLSAILSLSLTYDPNPRQSHQPTHPQVVSVVKKAVGRPIRDPGEGPTKKRAKRAQQVARRKSGQQAPVGRPRKEHPTRPKQAAKQRKAYAEQQLVNSVKLLQLSDSSVFQSAMIASSKTKAGAKEFDKIDQLVVQAETGAESTRSLQYFSKRVGRGNKQMYVHMLLDSGMSEDTIFDLAAGKLSRKYITAQFNNPPPAEEKTLFETQLYKTGVTRNKTHTVDEEIALEFFDDRTSVSSGSGSHRYCRQLRLEKYELEAQRFASYPYYLRKHLAEKPAILEEASSKGKKATRFQACLRAVDATPKDTNFFEEEYDRRLQVIYLYIEVCLYCTNI